jgi:uncharacterized protein (UPF0261 family)
MPKHIVILSTLDTKGEEAAYLKGLIEAQGFQDHSHGHLHRRGTLHSRTSRRKKWPPPEAETSATYEPQGTRER